MAEDSNQARKEFLDKYNEELNQRSWLKRRYNPPPDMELSTGETVPGVPHPTMFQPDPLVIGTPEFSKKAAEMYNSNPYLKSQIRQIGSAPTKAVFTETMKHGGDPYNFNDYHVMGMHDPDPKQKDIFVNPYWAWERDKTMAHEMAHAGGWWDNADVARFEGLYDKYIGDSGWDKWFAKPWEQRKDDYPNYPSDLMPDRDPIPLESLKPYSASVKRYIHETPRKK